MNETIEYKAENNQSLKLGWFICGLGALFYTYEYFLRISPSVMTTELMQAYHIGAEQLGNLVAFYYYAYAPAQLLVGVMMDRCGPRRILTIACLLCAVGSYLFAGTDHVGIAGIGRFAVGFGSAFAFVGVLKLATLWLPPERFALITGLTSALGTLGAMFGEVAMTELVDSIGWRPTVLLTAAIGAVLAIILFLFIRDGNESFHDSDASQEYQIDFKEIIWNLVRILACPQIWLNGLIGCLLYLPTTAFAELWGIPFFRAVYNFTGTEAAYAVSAIFLGFTIGAPINGFISDTIKLRCRPMFIGGMLAGGAMSLIILLPNLSHMAIYSLMFFLGFFYSAQVIVFAVGREISPDEAAGTAIAVTNGLVMLGGVVFQPVVGMMLDLHWGGIIENNIHVYSAANFRFATMLIPASLFLAAFLTLFLKETHGEVHDDLVKI